jgi:serine phosphatase RsbU (regulator of sigma subunit)
MRPWLKRNPGRQPLPEEPLRAEAPEIERAEIAAVYYGQRQAGDFYDFFRVNEKRVLFCLLDAAGDLQTTRSLISLTQRSLRDSAAKLLADDDINETDAMIELCLTLNRTVLNGSQKVHPCPAFVGCYNERLGLVCYFNAGHTPGLVRDQGGITALEATGLPLGLFSHATCDAPMVAPRPCCWSRVEFSKDNTSGTEKNSDWRG